MSDGQDKGMNSEMRRMERRKEEAHLAVDQMIGSLPNPPNKMKKNVVRKLEAYRKVLRPYRNERVLEPGWEEREPSPDITKALLRQGVERERELPGRGSATKTVKVPKAEVVEPYLLEELLEVLDDIKKELGFSDKADDPTPSEEANLSDLHGLMKARGQTEAVEQLPEASDDE